MITSTWNNWKKPQRAQRAQRKMATLCVSVYSVVDYPYLENYAGRKKKWFMLHNIDESKLIETDFNMFINYRQQLTATHYKNLVPEIKSKWWKTPGNFKRWIPNMGSISQQACCHDIERLIFTCKEGFPFLYLAPPWNYRWAMSRILVENGMVYAVEISPRAMKDLIRVSIPRNNVVPILADAMDPGSYKNKVSEVDFLYQDIAQREQARIALRNAELFLKKTVSLYW